MRYGGIFVGENYKPFMNTLTPLELKVLSKKKSRGNYIIGIR